MFLIIAKDKSLRRPNSVMTYKRNMESVKNIKFLRLYSKMKQDWDVKDMNTFQTYIRNKYKLNAKKM